MNIPEALDKVIEVGDEWTRHSLCNATTEYRKQVGGVRIFVSIIRRERFEARIIGDTFAAQTASEWSQWNNAPGVIETRAASTLKSALMEVEAEMEILKGEEQ